MCDTSLQIALNQPSLAEIDEQGPERETFARQNGHHSANVAQLVAVQAATAPETIAVTHGPLSLTYKELNQRADQLAHSLMAMGVGPDVIVGIYLNRSLAMIVAALAVLKAGGAYLPLDPNYPAERLAFMLEDAGAPIVLTHAALRERLGSFHADTVCLDLAGSVLAGEPATAPAALIHPQHPAYVIYTSGSTGEPKGVVGTHSGLANRLLAQTGIKRIAADDVCCQKTSIGFVDSVFEILGPLGSGACLVVVPDAAANDPEELSS